MYFYTHKETLHFCPVTLEVENVKMTMINQSMPDLINSAFFSLLMSHDCPLRWMNRITLYYINLECNFLKRTSLLKMMTNWFQKKETLVGV